MRGIGPSFDGEGWGCGTAAPAGDVTRNDEGQARQQRTDYPCFAKFARAIIAKPAAGPEAPPQAKHLGSALRAEVWFIHNEASRIGGRLRTRP